MTTISVLLTAMMLCAASSALAEDAKAPADGAAAPASSSSMAAPTTQATLSMKLYVPPAPPSAGEGYSVVTEIMNNGHEEVVLDRGGEVQDAKSFASQNGGAAAAAPASGWRLVLLYENKQNDADSRAVQRELPPNASVSIPPRQSILLKIALPPKYLVEGENTLQAVLQFGGKQIASTETATIRCSAGDK